MTDSYFALLFSDQFGGQIITAQGVYLVQVHGGCNGDFVYLVAVQNTEAACDWDRFNESEIPKILYSNSSSPTNANNCK